MASRQEMIFNAVERKRVVHIPFARARARKAIIAQAKPVFEQFTPYASLDNIITRVKGLIRKDSVEKAYQDIYVRVGTAFAKTSFRAVKGISDDMETKGIIDILLSDWRTDLIKVATFQAASRITGVTDYTADLIILELKKAIQEGLSIQDTAKNLVRRFGEFTLSRANIIARTEIISASNAGSLMGAVSTGLPFDKIWLAALDNRTRDTHVAAHGQRVDIDKHFFVGGEKLRYPGDPKGSPENVIACRCTQIYAQKGQATVI